MTNKEEQNNLPEYIKNSKQITKQDCLDLAASSKEPQTKEDKYILYLAQNYFRNNILQFSAEEFTIITQNKYFTKNLGHQYAEEILNKCIQYNQPFSIALSGWFNKKIPDSKKSAYLNIMAIRKIV